MSIYAGDDLHRADADRLREYLSRFTIKELRTKIDEVRDLDFRNASDRQLFDALNNVLVFGESGMHMPISRVFPAGTNFWRARRASTGPGVAPDADMRRLGDAWAPPPHCVKSPGRLNFQGESILYVCPDDAELTLREARIPEGEPFYLIRYRAKRPVTAVEVPGQVLPGWELTETETDKYEMLLDFFKVEFTRDAAPGTEYLYRLSNTIARSFYDLPPHVQDAWIYPSVEGRPRLNVALRPQKASECLELLGVARCEQWVKDGENKKISAYIYTDARELGESGFVWHPQGSETQKRCFPQFTPPRRGSSFMRSGY